MPAGRAPRALSTSDLPHEETQEKPHQNATPLSAAFLPKPTQAKRPSCAEQPRFLHFPLRLPAPGPLPPAPHTHRSAPHRAGQHPPCLAAVPRSLRCVAVQGDPPSLSGAGFLSLSFFFFLLPLVQGSPASPRSLAVLPQATVCSLSSPPVPRWFCAEGTADGKEMLSFCFSDVL